MKELPAVSWRQTVNRSLRNQLRWRLVMVFLGVTVLGSLFLLAGYRTIVQGSQKSAANDMAEHVMRAYRLDHDSQQLNAHEVAAQIAFMRIFSSDNPSNTVDSWVRLRAFFGAMEGKSGRFPSGVVLANEKMVFKFGADGGALGQVLQNSPTGTLWYHSVQQQAVYGLYYTDLWLGSQGKGTLVLARPIDNGWLRALAPVDAELALVFDGRVIASSSGSQGLGQAANPEFAGRLTRDGVSYEQRILPVLGQEPHLPRLVLMQKYGDPISAPVLFAASTGLMGLLAAVLWLVIGRWTQRLTGRVAELSRASSLFAHEHRLGDDLRQALAKAAEKPDEVAQVAQSCGELMQSVLEHDEVHKTYTQGLDRLNQELESRVQQRTLELTHTVEKLTRMQKELVESEKLASLGAMVAGISHELNTPIGNAVTVTSTLLSKVEDFKDLCSAGTLKRSSMAEFLDSLAQAADLIARSVNRAAALVTSFKQVAVDRESERQREFDLRDLVHDLVTSLKPGMRHKAVVVVEDIPVGLVCNSFPGPIGQVLMNLIQNAVFHGFAHREGGQIQLRAEVQATLVVVTVADDGEGMSDHVLKHAFDPFFTTRMGQGGSGLGLSVSHSIATAMLGGSLSAETTLGHGSCFRFSFPREAPPAPVDVV